MHDVNVRAYLIAFLFTHHRALDGNMADYWVRGSSVGSMTDLGLQEILVSMHIIVQPLTTSNSLLTVDNIHSGDNGKA